SLLRFMHKNKLLILLSKLDRKEMTRFKDFVHSPYFSKHKNVAALVAYLSKIYPNFTERNCNQEKLYPIVLEGKKHNRSELALIFTYAKRLLERFLIIEGQQDLELSKNIVLLQKLRKQEQHSIYEKQLQITQDWLTESDLQDADYQYANYQIAKEKDQYYRQLHQYKSDDSLQKKQNCLDRFYLSEKLRDACEILVRQSHLQVDYSSRLLDVLINEVEQNWDYYQSIPSIAVYYEIYQMLQINTMITYQKALERVTTDNVHFSQYEQKIIYQYLQNYCTAQLNKGYSEYLRQWFDLTRLQLEKKLLFEQNHLSEWHYKNLVTVGLRLGEQIWVEKFVEDYRIHLHPDQQEHAYTFNLATLRYYQKKYDKVLDLLKYLDISDVRYSFSAKSMLLCTYYELEEEEALIALCESFDKYIKRQQKVSKDYQNGFENFVKLVRRLTSLKEKLAYEKREKIDIGFQKIEQAIAEESNIFNKKWLVEKLEELKG
ncbi:MAG: hypothetical protein AAF806_17910, partial [Bacteroidota bacterium]